MHKYNNPLQDALVFILGQTFSITSELNML